jgi:hypothetical protein
MSDQKHTTAAHAERDMGKRSVKLPRAMPDDSPLTDERHIATRAQDDAAHEAGIMPTLDLPGK